MAFTLDEEGRGISIHGWRVRATKSPIIGDTQVEAVSRQLGGVLTVPEILFGNSRLELAHAPSGVTLLFDALDALRAWREEDLPPLKVTLAQQWQAARREEIERQQALVLEYDWTYTTSYQGTLVLGGGSGGSSGGGEGGGEGVASASSNLELRQICTSLQAQPQSPTAAAQAHETATAATASGVRPGGRGHAPTGITWLPATEVPAATHGGLTWPRASLPMWQPTQQQADRALLMSRDEPILFFAEVPLYESELDDNGCSQLVAKVRVMPRCWLVLLRFWLRVDGCLVRLRETRFFCRWAGPGRGGFRHSAASVCWQGSLAKHPC
jgi:type 2A phosphatase activator TIP41